jgi:mono/diheme cytochrome c family protein
MKIAVKVLGCGFAAGLSVAGAAAGKPLSYPMPEEATQLRSGQGPGYQAAQNNCLSCHSADYVAMQPPKQGAAFWQAEVTKMIKVYRAPIDEADAKTIADYLAQAY